MFFSNSPSSTDPPGRNTPTPQAARSSDGVHVIKLCKSVGKNIGETKTYGLYWFRNIKSHSKLMNKH
jgi:hypothetical protein